MTTVNFTNLTTDVLKVVMPSGETIIASSAGVSVSTAPEVTNVVAQSPVAAPAPAPVAITASAAVSGAAPAALVIPAPPAPSAVIVGVAQ